MGVALDQVEGVDGAGIGMGRCHISWRPEGCGAPGGEGVAEGDDGDDGGQAVIGATGGNDPFVPGRNSPFRIEAQGPESFGPEAQDVHTVPDVAIGRPQSWGNGLVGIDGLEGIFESGDIAAALFDESFDDPLVPVETTFATDPALGLPGQELVG